MHHQNLENTQPAVSCFPGSDDAPQWEMCDFCMGMGSCYKDHPRDEDRNIVLASWMWYSLHKKMCFITTSHLHTLNVPMTSHDTIRSHDVAVLCLYTLVIYKTETTYPMALEWLRSWLHLGTDGSRLGGWEAMPGDRRYPPKQDLGVVSWSVWTR